VVGEDGYAHDESGAAVRPRRRGPSIKTVLLMALLLILVITSIGGILVWQRVSRFNDSVSTAPAASSALWGALGGTDRVNIALFGYGGASHKSGNYLADSIQIMSIDPKTDTTTVIPIPRDFWVEGMREIPDNGKINEAFAIGHADGGIDGAAKLTARVLSRVTGLHIDHWMAIDFTGFEELIDAVGGVEVRNPRRFRYTYNEWKWSHGVWDGIFQRGYLELNGTRALDYARARYTNLTQESSDFARSVRQQRVLSALRSKLGSGGIGSIGPGLGMMDALDGKMRTDLSAIDLLLLSSHLNPDYRIELKEGRVLEATTNTNGQYILVVVGRADASDYTPLQQYLKDHLAHLSRKAAKPTPSPSQ
jgi:polyisoprenyl-teichoic acid--peptidoglycan teichoic acid transferase